MRLLTIIKDNNVVVLFYYYHQQQQQQKHSLIALFSTAINKHGAA